MVKRWYRVRKNQVLMIVMLFLVTVSITVHSSIGRVEYLTDRNEIKQYIESNLEEALKEDKGTGCTMPKLDLFSNEVIQFDKPIIAVECVGDDWVTCWLSECKVKKHILNTYNEVECSYKDILYENDTYYYIGPSTTLKGDQVYTLTNSDHVKVDCVIKPSKNGLHLFENTWSGNLVGLRKVKPIELSKKKPTVNVLILGFDSTAKNGFIRRMPKSYQVLREELKAIVLNSYNIVGDGTPASIVPLLTGKTDLELPESRISIEGSGYCDVMPFIFYKLKAYGYRTAYFEDMPQVGTFQWRFNGFLRQPADHYLRAFFLEEYKKYKLYNTNIYCVGDTPSYKLMLNITDQFFHLDGKQFAFTFIADITHDDFNMISTADETFAEFLQDFKTKGRLKDTLLFVMGDHGPRCSKLRSTLQGKLEERLPLMAIVLPEVLKRDRPEAQSNLQSNVDTLTTPHDIHATILDALDMQEFMNPYKVKGADLTRALSLLDRIPRNRSCSEAGIEPHWCACVRWDNVSKNDPIFRRVANALLDYINSVTKFVRSKCALRTLTSIQWVMHQTPNEKVLAFQRTYPWGYQGRFKEKDTSPNDIFQVKIVVGPGEGMYEGTIKYSKSENKLLVNYKAISRTNAFNTDNHILAYAAAYAKLLDHEWYNQEPSCVSAVYPHLNMFCYCK